ncbi:MAG: hypothetical protein II820_04150, partial [Ruminiclostridium sp.]|nr:hypothetical protein [Ruminiclostridium sp.]
MKKQAKYISFALCAALLLSGCNTGTAQPADTEPTGTTASVSEVTPAPETTTTAKVAAIAGEDDDKLPAKTEDKAPSDIMQYTLNQLNGKSINCENRSSLHMNSTDDWKLQPGDAPQLDYDGNNPYFEFKHDSYRFTPQA